MSKNERLDRRGFLQFSVGAITAFVGTRRGLATEIGPQLIDVNEVLELNERVREIFSHYTPLAFDGQGNLLFESVDDSKKPIYLQTSLLPTEFSKSVKEKVKSVKILVVHFDAAVRYLRDGTERNAKNTVNGLNGNDPDGDGIGASTQWCVDGFPISRNENGEGGYGVLQTQFSSGDPERPYRGKHIFIGIDLKSGQEDVNAIETIERFNKLGIKSNLERLVTERKYRHASLNKYSVGFEQIGTYFDPGFPDFDQPTRRQYANSLALTLICMKQFGLTPWDVVGHHEIQQKSDPGYYYMGTFRFLIGVAALKGLVPKELVFEEEDGVRKELKYFERVNESVLTINRYGRHPQWQTYVGYQDLVDSLNLWYRLNNVRKPKNLDNSKIT